MIDSAEYQRNRRRSEAINRLDEQESAIRYREDMPHEEADRLLAKVERERLKLLGPSEPCRTRHDELHRGDQIKFSPAAETWIVVESSPVGVDGWTLLVECTGNHPRGGLLRGTRLKRYSRVELIASPTGMDIS